MLVAHMATSVQILLLDEEQAQLALLYTAFCKYSAARSISLLNSGGSAKLLPATLLSPALQSPDLYVVLLESCHQGCQFPQHRWLSSDPLLGFLCREPAWLDVKEHIHDTAPAIHESLVTLASSCRPTHGRACQLQADVAQMDSLDRNLVPYVPFFLVLCCVLSSGLAS